MRPSPSDLEAAADLRRWTDERTSARKRARTLAAEFGRTNLTRDAREVIRETLLQAGLTTRPSLLDCGRDDWLQLVSQGRKRSTDTGRTPPAHWRFLAGPESLIAYETDKRRSVAAWTADRSGQAARGDLVALYATGRLQRYMAIARVCCRPVENAKAHPRRRDREWWTYLQTQPLARTIPRAELESQGFAQSEGSGLKTPRGSGSNRISDAVAGEAFDFLVHGDAGSADTLRRWRAGSGAWPKGLDVEELQWADWERPERKSPEELLLSEQIAAHLVKTGAFRYVRPDDDVGPDRRGAGNAARLSLEHPIRDDAGKGRIDVLLVDQRRPQTLLAIEVKLRATLAPNRNPVPQIIRYRAALQQRDGDRWNIRHWWPPSTSPTR